MQAMCHNGMKLEALGFLWVILTYKKESFSVYADGTDSM